MVAQLVRRQSFQETGHQEMMTEMIASKEAQENLHSPWFMFKTLMF